MRRSTVMALLAVGVVVVVGFRIFSADRSNQPTATVNSLNAATMPSTPMGPVVPAGVDEFGVPHGWRHDSDGALAAAVSAVRLTGAIARAGFITRSDIIASLATARYGPALATASANQLTEMTAELGTASVAPADLVWSEIPLTARVTASDELRARVEVWSVLIVGVPEVGAPRQAWRTVAIDLAWEQADWRVDGWTATAGPTPLLDATAAIASTQEVEQVASWPSTPSGGG